MHTAVALPCTPDIFVSCKYFSGLPSDISARWTAINGHHENRKQSLYSPKNMEGLTSYFSGNPDRCLMDQRPHHSQTISVKREITICPQSLHSVASSHSSQSSAIDHRKSGQPVVRKHTYDLPKLSIPSFTDRSYPTLTAQAPKVPRAQQYSACSNQGGAGSVPLSLPSRMAYQDLDSRFSREQSSGLSPLGPVFELSPMDFPGDSSYRGTPRSYEEMRADIQITQSTTAAGVSQHSSKARGNGHSGQIRLPSIEMLLSSIREEPSRPLDGSRYELFRDPFHSKSLVQRPTLPPLGASTLLPLPRPLERNSSVAYSLPAGIVRSRSLPSPPPLTCRSSIRLRPPITRRPRLVHHQAQRGPVEHTSHSAERADGDYPPLPTGMRQVCRRVMSETEKRARKAAQQQRRRKYGPMREARERFSKSEDLWLVTEKRRLEKEPNKHWTDLEYAHKARFPEKNFRTLSGLQSRYYRIKKKFERILDAKERDSRSGSTLPTHTQERSRWDEEIEGRYSESGDLESDGELEGSDDCMMESDDVDSYGPGEEKCMDLS